MTPQPPPLASEVTTEVVGEVAGRLVGGPAGGVAADGEHAQRVTAEIPVAAVVSGVPALALSRVGVRQLPSFVGTSAKDLAAMLGRLDAGGCYREVQIWMKGRPRLVEIPDDNLAQVQRRVFGHLTCPGAFTGTCAAGRI